jgi:hypothetical protein
MMTAHRKLRALALRVRAQIPLIPAKAGIQSFFCLALDPRFRGDERVKAGTVQPKNAFAAGTGTAIWSWRSDTPQQPGDTQWFA